jgi:hypothetical protein
VLHEGISVSDVSSAPSRRRTTRSNRLPARRSFRFGGRFCFGKAKFAKQTFDVYLTDIETGDETLAITVFAPTQREAIQMAKKRLQSSPVLRNITHAAFTAVKVEQ